MRSGLGRAGRRAWQGRGPRPRWPISPTSTTHDDARLPHPPDRLTGGLARTGKGHFLFGQPCRVFLVASGCRVRYSILNTRYRNRLPTEATWLSKGSLGRSSSPGRAHREQTPVKTTSNPSPLTIRNLRADGGICEVDNNIGLDGGDSGVAVSPHERRPSRCYATTVVPRCDGGCRRERNDEEYSWPRAGFNCPIQHCHQPGRAVVVSTFVTNVAAVAAVIGMLTGVYVYTCRLLIKEIDKDLLADWDRRLALASPDERDDMRSRPPVDVLEAIFAMSSPRERRIASAIRRWSGLTPTGTASGRIRTPRRSDRSSS
jgi:hypothetical protein